MDAGMENSTDNHSDAHADHEQQKGGIGQSRGVASRPTPEMQEPLQGNHEDVSDQP